MTLLDADQMDALTEIFNIGIGRAAATLNDIVDAPVELVLPSLRVAKRCELLEMLPNLANRQLSTVNLGFTGTLSGDAGLIFSEEDASKLVGALVGSEADAEDLDELRVGALTEVGNIVLNGIMGSISNTLEQHLRYSPPEFIEDSLDNLYRTTESNADDPILVAGAAIQVRRLRIDGEIVVVLEMGMMEELIRALQPLLV